MSRPLEPGREALPKNPSQNTFKNFQENPEKGLRKR